MKLDIGRLHKVALSQFHSRRSGKTVLACCNVIGTLDTTDGNILCIVAYRNDINHMLPQMVDILKHFNFDIDKIVQRDTIHLIDGRIIRFIQYNTEKLHGLNDWYYQDFRDH